jgi:hypothetical protein
MPPGIDNAYVDGSAGTNWIVADGSNYPEPRYGIIWHNEQPRIMLRFRGGASNYPRDINSSGTVVGASVGSSGTPEPYSYRTFYHWLPKPAAGHTYATWINDRGDIAGFVDDNGSVYDDSPKQVVFWKAGSSTYRILGEGFPVGIDETGRVVTASGEIFNPDGTRGRLQTPAGVTGIAAMTFNDGVVAGYGIVSADDHVALVWDVAGNVVSSIPGATAKAANSHGIVLGFAGASSSWSSADVWRNGVHDATISYPRPNFSDVPDPFGGDSTVTADDAIIATPAGLPEPSYWRCSGPS